ncbi:MAG TPA: DUF3999 family protein [Thermoanaerobaculia bacterium]|nr:DUF3999 family protein [Thermoanaerobaculia bacterium]
MRLERAFGFLPAIVLVAGFSLVRPLHSLDGFTYTRDLDVPAAGRVRVPLDIGALRHMAPGGADLRVFAPDGRAVPFRLSVSLPESGRRPALVSKGQDAWLLLDTGADPVPHERLVLDLASEGPVPSLDLEGSLDGTVWEPLVTGTPARLRAAEGIQRVALSYPTTPARYLRLLWPAAPQIAAAEVETVPGPLLTLATQGARCGLAPSSSVCTLELPSGQVLRRIILDIEGQGRTGYRLYAPRESRWELLAEGVWQEAGRHVLAGGPQAIAGSALRLELHGAGGPRLTGYGMDLAVPTVVFQAPGPGRYLLAYGGIEGEEPPESRRTDAGGLWVEPGPEQQGEPPPLPSPSGEPLDRARFSSSWTLASNAEPGDLVRLELPPAVYGAAREDLGDLRLAVEGRQIPFFRWSPPDPVYTGGGPGLRPSGSDRPGESRVVVSLPSESLPLTQIHLTAPATPLQRPVTILYVDPDRSTPSIPRTTWECEPEPPLPCRTLLPLPGPAPRLLTVRLRDGDEPPLRSVGVSVWRRRDVLLFVWPEIEDDDTVRLLAGARDLEAARYEIADIAPALLGQPWQAAEIRSGGAQPEIPWWSRWVMPVGVTIVAVWLVTLLRRILAEA